MSSPSPSKVDTQHPFKHVTPDLKGIPKTLKALQGDHYITWRPRQNKVGVKKWIKFPLQKTSDQASHLPWSKVEDAVSPSTGLGLIASNRHSILVIDIDGVNYETNKELKELLTNYPTYIEASPSGYKKHKYHAIYSLMSVLDKNKLMSKPAVTLGPSGIDPATPEELVSKDTTEIQFFNSTGYTTLTGRSLKETLPDIATDDVTLISLDTLTSLWPSILSNLEEKISLTQYSPGTDIQANTPLNNWITLVSCDPSNPVVKLIMAAHSVNFYDYWLHGITAIHATYGDTPQAKQAAMAWSQSDPTYYDDQIEKFESTWASLSAPSKDSTISSISAGTYEDYYNKFLPKWPRTNEKGFPLVDQLANFDFFIGYLGLSIEVDALTQEAFLDGPLDVLVPKIHETELEATTAGTSQLLKSTLRLTRLAEEYKYYPKQAMAIQFFDYLAAAKHEGEKVNRYAREIDKTTWDGQDYIQEFTDTIIVRNKNYAYPNAEMHHVLIKKWLLSLVRSFYTKELHSSHQGAEAEGMLIVSATQGGVGKTDLPNHMFLPGWGKLHAMASPEGIKDFQDKDFLAQIVTAPWVTFDEVDNILASKNEGSLKQFITAKSDTYRTPYDRHPRTFPRVSSIYATTNKTDLILPREGTRRWWWLNIERNDIGKLKAGWPIAQLWAQLKQTIIYESNNLGRSISAPWHLTKKERNYLTSYIADFTTENSTDGTLEDEFIMTTRALYDKLAAGEERKIPASHLTLCRKEIADILGIPSTKALTNTIKRQLARIAPGRITYGRTAFYNGVYQVNRQDRFLMPPRRPPVIRDSNDTTW